MFRAQVLIIRRSKLHYTASGIIIPIGGRLVHVHMYVCMYVCMCICVYVYIYIYTSAYAFKRL